MSDRERERDWVPGFDERAPWVIPMADEAEDDDQPDEESESEQGFDVVAWR